MRYWITPSLAISDDSLEIEEWNDALALIELGQDGFVGTLEEAASVLMALGLSDDEIRSKIDFALGMR